MADTFIVAECGVNHNGSLDKAYKMIESAHKCGANAAKFQYYDTFQLMLNRNLSLDTYNKLHNIRTRKEWLPDLKKQCDKYGIQFLCTGFCKSDFDEIDPYVSAHKISHMESENKDFCGYVYSCNKPLILSFTKEYIIKTLQEYEICRRLVVLYCTPDYPTEEKNIDFEIFDILKKHKVPYYGFSDHTAGIEKAVEAATKHKIFMLEKHFCLDKDCIDANVSVTPDQFKEMVDRIRCG